VIRPFYLDPIPFNPVLLKKVEDLELSARTTRGLIDSGIGYVGDLVQKEESDLLHFPNIDRASLNQIKDALWSLGCCLGMEVLGWPPANLEELAERFDDPY
jgi:DNA-directed RNA polymerase subunit alpha